MKDNYKLHECGSDDVIAFDDIVFKVGKFERTLEKVGDNDLGSEIFDKMRQGGVVIPDNILSPPAGEKPYARWFNDGMDCEILNLGAKKWKKGIAKIKISFELYVEEETDSSADISEPESPLNDLRQRLNQENQQ